MSSVPNFIYIGPDKAGSSWLHEVLITHPQIFMPEAKDLYFFDRYFSRGMQWYLGQFAGAGPQHKVVGEVCQDYLFFPEAARRIKDSLGGDVRFMVTLRDPADRAFSSYLYMQKHGERVGPFIETLTTRPELIEHGRYASGLARFTALFGEDCVHVAVFDDLVEDPQSFVDSLLSWLRVDPLTLDAEQLAARLPASTARSVWLSRLVRVVANLVREKGDGANVIGRVKRSRLVQRTLYRTFKDDKPVMTDEERAAVHAILGEEIAALDDRYGLGLAKRWGWDVVAAREAQRLGSTTPPDGAA